MKLYEYGQENEKKFLFFASCIMQPYWVYEDTINILAQKYHVYVMSADGHDESVSDEFTSVEKNVEDLIGELNLRKVAFFDAAYGLSMGGAMLMRFLTTSGIPVKKAIIDGGITPYSYPPWICKLILMRDFITARIISRNRWLLEKLFPPEKYTVEGHDADKEYDKLMEFYKTYTGRTIKNAFWSANNYDLPKPAPKILTKIQYWCAEYEKKARKENMKFVSIYFPQTEFKIVKGYGHGELMMIHPKEFYEYVLNFLNPDDKRESR